MGTGLYPRLRNTGLDVIPEVSWGTHFCQLFETAEDLTEVLTRFIGAGLNSNELCVWVPAVPSNSPADTAPGGIPALDRYVKSGQLLVVPHTDWYFKDGSFDADSTLARLDALLLEAARLGYDGVRTMASASWVRQRHLKEFIEYEHRLNDAVNGRPALMLCAYRRAGCSTLEAVEITSNHRHAIISRDGALACVTNSAHEPDQQAPIGSGEPVPAFRDDFHGITIRCDSVRKASSLHGAVELITGYSRAELAREDFSWRSIIHPEDTVAYNAVSKRLRNPPGDRPEDTIEQEYRIIRKDGAVRWVHETVSTRGALGAAPLRGFIYDITASRAAQEQVLREKHFTRSLLDCLHEGIGVADLNGMMFMVNPALARITGYSEQELLGMTPPYAFWPDEDIDYIYHRFKRVFDGDTSPVEMTFRRKDGRSISVLSTPFPIPDESGRTMAFGGLVTDITERRKWEKNLLKEKKFSESLIKVLPGTFYVIDETGKMLRWNRNLEAVTGYSAEEIKGMAPEDFFAAKDSSLVSEKMAEVFTNGFASMKAELISRDGRRIPHYFTAMLLDTAGSRSIVGVGFDITEDARNERALLKAREELETRVRERTSELERANKALNAEINERRRAEEARKDVENQLLQSQKLELIGELSGGIAHDFNNIMTVIKALCNLALKPSKGPEGAARYLKQIGEASDRATTLTRQLLILGRKQPAQFVALNLNDTLSEFLKMLKRLIGEHVTVETDLNPDLRGVKADRVSVEQLLMNLVINARDAVGSGGTITISTENVALDASACERIGNAAQPGNYVCLTVEDDGTGMDEEVLERLFEPFFSTKGIGTGAGLGLPVVMNIVRLHNGCVDVQSTRGEGSTFKVYLPALASGVKPDIQKTDASEPARGSGERILLVEDEGMLRRSVSLLLTMNGYTVVEAKDAVEAGEVFEKEPGGFALLFTDTVLPDGSGVHLIEELGGKAPEMKVLLTSGYLDIESQWPVIKERGYKFLQKPYEPADLLRGIREVLNGG